MAALKVVLLDKAQICCEKDQCFNQMKSSMTGAQKRGLEPLGWLRDVVYLPIPSYFLIGRYG